MTPTQRALAWLRSHGYTCGTVERYVPATRRRHDLYGGIDLIAIRPGSPPLGVQVCGSTGVSDHRAKLAAEPRMHLWLRTGAGLVIAAPYPYTVGRRRRWRIRVWAAALDGEQLVWSEATDLWDAAEMAAAMSKEG